MIFEVVRVKEVFQDVFGLSDEESSLEECGNTLSDQWDFIRDDTTTFVRNNDIILLCNLQQQCVGQTYSYASTFS